MPFPVAETDFDAGGEHGERRQTVFTRNCRKVIGFPCQLPDAVLCLRSGFEDILEPFRLHQPAAGMEFSVERKIFRNVDDQFVVGDMRVVLEDERALERPRARGVILVFIFDDTADFDARQAADENLRGIVFRGAGDP